MAKIIPMPEREESFEEGAVNRINEIIEMMNSHTKCLEVMNVCLKGMLKRVNKLERKLRKHE